MKRLLALIFINFIAVFFTATVAIAGSYREPKTGENPHGNYSNVGDKCKVCHATHAAKAGAQTLLRSTRADACVYCHVSNNFAIKRPYGTNPIAYTNEYDWNHDDNHNGYTSATLYAGCVSCHSVHGANTFGDAAKILKSDPGKAISAPVNNENDFCRDCHNFAGNNIKPGGCFNLCHASDSPIALPSDYLTPARDGTTHIMTTTLTGNYGTQVAWITSELCRRCHQASRSIDRDSFPHYTPNAVQFLDYAYTEQDTNLDLVCMNCHTDTGNGNSYTSGVGKTFQWLFNSP